jgi:hypothetical protein
LLFLASRFISAPSSGGLRKRFDRARRGLSQAVRATTHGAPGATLTDEPARRLRDHESPAVEQRFFVFGETHTAIHGRYWWGSASPNDRCTAHSGWSFVECLVPVLRIWHR